MNRKVASEVMTILLLVSMLPLSFSACMRMHILTYMTGIDVKTAFNKLQEVLGIKAFTEESEDIVKTMEEKMKGLENAIIQLEQENMNFKTRIDLLQKSQKENIEQTVAFQKEIKRINNMVEILYPKEVMRFLPHYELEEIVTWKETFNTPEEYTESEREFRRMVAKAQNKQRDEEYREYIKRKHAKIVDTRGAVVPLEIKSGDRL